VRNVFVERCEMSSPQLERGIRVKTNALRGGTVENLFVRDVVMGEAGSAIDVDMQYEEGAAGPFTPVVRNVRVQGLQVGKARRALSIRGLEKAPVEDVSVSDSVFREVAQPSRLEHVRELLLRNVVLRPVEPAGGEERR
jgi:polygalacturonase